MIEIKEEFERREPPSTSNTKKAIQQRIFYYNNNNDQDNNKSPGVKIRIFYHYEDLNICHDQKY